MLGRPWLVPVIHLLELVRLENRSFFWTHSPPWSENTPEGVLQDPFGLIYTVESSGAACQREARGSGITRAGFVVSALFFPPSPVSLGAYLGSRPRRGQIRQPPLLVPRAGGGGSGPRGAKAVVLIKMVTGRRPMEAEYGEGNSIVEWVRARVVREEEGGASEVLDPAAGAGRKEVREEMMLVLRLPHWKIFTEVVAA